MNKSQIICVIKARIASLDAAIDRIEKLNLNAVMDSLVISSMLGVVRFYKAPGQGGNRKYTSDKSEIRTLAQKRYCEKLKDAAEKEKKQMNMCLVHLQKEVPNSDVEKVFESLPDALKKFVKPDLITDDGYAEAWQTKKVICCKKTSAHSIKTMSGEYVRSKSEALIADRFYSLGIPYRYEQRFVVDEPTEFYLHPDFRVLNKRTRKEYIWEHCGRIDESNYSNDALDRLAVFASKGYLQGKNLIFTYETKDKPLNLDYVDKLIEEYLR